MTWLTENWFSVLVFIAFAAMHVFGHGGHGGHSGHGAGGRQPGRDDGDKDEARGRAVRASSGGHQH